jgi:integrase
MATFKKGNRQYIDYYLPNGNRKREVVKIKGVDPERITRQDALKCLSIRKGEIAQGKFNIDSTKRHVLFEVFLGDYLETYSKPNKKSWDRDETSAKALLRFFTGKTLQQITGWLIEKYKIHRQNEDTQYRRPPSVATINRELALLKHMLSKALRENIISSNPAKEVKLFPERPNKLRVISGDEFLKLYNQASDFLKPILVIAINTGMRRSEILNLTWDDVDLVKRYIYVGDTKNNDYRIIPINETLLKIFKALKSESQNNCLFANGNGEAVKSVKTAFWGALRRSGIPHCRFHDLRHTFASNLVMAGVDIVTVQELMGHKDISMTRRYSHPTPDHKKQAVEKLNQIAMDTYLDTGYTSEPPKDNVTSLNH